MSFKETTLIKTTLYLESDASYELWRHGGGGGGGGIVQYLHLEVNPL